MIERAEKKDLEQIVELMCDLKKKSTRYETKCISSGLKENIEKYILNAFERNNAYMFVFKRECVVLGFLLAVKKNIYPKIYEDSTILEIKYLVVKKGERCKGIGSEMIRHFMDFSKNMNVGAVYLSVFSENKEAVNFYKNNNFRNHKIVLIRDVDKGN